MKTYGHLELQNRCPTRQVINFGACTHKNIPEFQFHKNTFFNKPNTSIERHKLGQKRKEKRGHIPWPRQIRVCDWIFVFLNIWIEWVCCLFFIHVGNAYVQDARLMEDSTIIIERGRQHCVIVVINVEREILALHSYQVSDLRRTLSNFNKALSLVLLTSSIFLFRFFCRSGLFGSSLRLFVGRFSHP